MSASDDRISSGYDVFYAAWGTSPTLRQIWRDHVTGTDYPEAFAHISFLSLTQLRALTDALALRPGDTLVDLACGAGGPGLWAATETGARLIGVDLSTVAVDRARERALALDMADRAAFSHGSFASTGLADASADAVMSIDALQYTPDKSAALREIARIVCPGGRLGLITFELAAERIEGMGVWDDAVGDFRPLLDDAGFDVLSYDQLDGWRELVAAGFGAVLEQQEALTAELGEPAATALVLEATITLQLEPYSGHAFAVAQRRAD